MLAWRGQLTLFTPFTLQPHSGAEFKETVSWFPYNMFIMHISTYRNHDIIETSEMGIYCCNVIVKTNVIKLMEIIHFHLLHFYQCVLISISLTTLPYPNTMHQAVTFVVHPYTQML